MLKEKEQSARVQSFTFSCNAYLNIKIKSPTCVSPLNKACMDAPLVQYQPNEGKRVLRFSLWFPLESTNEFLIHTWGFCTKKYPEEKVSDLIAGKFVRSALCIKIIILGDNFYYFTQSSFNLIIIYHSSIPFSSW